MNWEATGSVSEIIGALAVRVTLIYLAIQGRHTRRDQKADAIRANRYTQAPDRAAIWTDSG